MLGSELVGTQAARDSALQRLSVLAASVGPEACAAAGVTHDAQHAGESIANGHLQKIAELEREVRRGASCRLVMHVIQLHWQHALTRRLGIFFVIGCLERSSGSGLNTGNPCSLIHSPDRVAAVYHQAGAGWQPPLKLCSRRGKPASSCWLRQPPISGCELLTVFRLPPKKQTPGQLLQMEGAGMQVRRLRKAQKLSGAMVVSARRQSLAASPAPAGMIQGGSSPMPLPLASPAPFNCALDSITDAEDDLAFDEEFAASEQAHMCAILTAGTAELLACIEALQCNILPALRLQKYTAC